MLLLTYLEIKTRQDIENNATRMIKKDIYINQVPCKDTQTIDQLWTRHSEERFGFSTQIRIWGINKKNWNNFGSGVGCRASGKWLTSYSDFTFELWAKEGQLPVRCHMWSFAGLFFPGSVVISALESRLVECSN